MEDDERYMELETISAIYPEIVLSPDNPYSATLEIPVHPAKPVTVAFPATDIPTPPPSDSEDGNINIAANPLESHTLTYLPSLQLQMVLPEGYPAERPADFKLFTSPEWLPRARLDELEESARDIWEDQGHTEVIFAFIDSLQQAAENAFGCGEGESWGVPQEYMISLLDFDSKACQAAFEKQTFDCATCLEPKKGSVCHQMIDCGHVFCVSCLQEYYNGFITAGDVISVRCMEFGCAKERAEKQTQGKKKRKPKTNITPSELLQIPLEHDMVSRYVRLTRKADLESDKNTVYCPRKWCQGAAKSKKHRKPEGFETVDSDGESDVEDSKVGQGAERYKVEDRLSICEDCDFAFCSRCFMSWHGEFAHCVTPKKKEVVSAEEQASLDYINLHTTPCPTCSAPSQKTHGCNHMICSKCNSHFCYLCSAWLEPHNPYKHYNDIKTGCFQRLWELEAGDGDDVGIGFAGGVEQRQAVERNALIAEIQAEDLEQAQPAGDGPPELVDRLRDIVARDPAADAAPAGELNRLDQDRAIEAMQVLEQQALVQQAAAAPAVREGPLVLRINHVPVPPAQVPVAPRVPDAPRRRQGQRALPRPVGQAARQANNAREGARLEAAAQARDAAAHRWMERFLQAAANDEEDLLDSDEEGDDAAWRIEARR